MSRASVLALGLFAALAAIPSAQQPPLASVAATADAADLPRWSDRTDRMLREGRLDIAAIENDTMLPGRTHERLEQRHEGLPVFGAQLVRQIDGGRVRSVFGRVYDNIDVAARPSIDASAVPALAAAGDATAAPRGQPVLGVLPTARGFALAWRLRVRSAHDLRDVYVNAVTGRIERSDSRIRTQVTEGSVGHGAGIFGDDKKISTDRGGGGFEARDLLRPGRTETYDFKGEFDRVIELFDRGDFVPGDIARDDDNVWTDGVVVDAHVYLGWTYDFFFKEFGRHGMDDHNRLIQAVVHPVSRDDIDTVDDDVFGTFVDNAAYFGDGLMIFGDGDGEQFTYFAGALDVTAHEWSHGVTDYSSGLIYRDESGALNESFSDIMAATAEFFFAEQGVTPHGADWLIGEDITIAPPGFIRSMSSPAAGGQPDHFSLRQYIGTDIDNGGVHINSGIPNNAFYLAVNGGRNRVSGIAVAGVGQANIDRVAKIFYRAFVFFLTPSATFSDARAATLQAASELYGDSSNERQQVRLAWDAVGVK
jgi:thermolysin